MTKIKDKYAADLIYQGDIKMGSTSDSSGTNTVTVNNSPVWENSNVGRCLRTDNGYLSLDSITNYLKDTDDYSILVRFKADQTTGPMSLFASATAGNNRMEMGVWGDKVRVGSYTTSYDTVSADFTDIGNWHILGMTNISSAKKGYLDGVMFDTAIGTHQSAANVVTTVGAKNDSTLNFEGNIAEVIVFKTGLTDAEMSQAYTEMKQSAHYDRVDIKQLTDPARNRLPNGDFEDWTGSTPDNFTAWANVTLSEQSGARTGGEGTSYLRATTVTGVNAGVVSNQNLLTVGKTYRLTGWCRTDGVNGRGTIYLGGSIATYVTSAGEPNWTYFDVTKVADGVKVYLVNYPNSTPGAYTEWDDVKLQEVPNVDPVYIADGQGWNESLANETAGFLSNTGFTINSGTWKVEDNGDGTKKNSNITSGILSMPCTQASGTWEFDLFHSAATETRLYFMASSTAAHTVAGQTGYMFSVLGTERLALHRNNGDTTSTTLFQTDTGYVPEDAWVRYKVTKGGSTITGYFSTDSGRTWTEIVESSGNNPATDATYTSSAYCVLNLGTADAARNFIFKPYIE
jgi:hypothetical protein